MRSQRIVELRGYLETFGMVSTCSDSDDDGGSAGSDIWVCDPGDLISALLDENDDLRQQLTSIRVRDDQQGPDSGIPDSGILGPTWASSPGVCQAERHLRCRRGKQSCSSCPKSPHVTWTDLQTGRRGRHPWTSA